MVIEFSNAMNSAFPTLRRTKRFFEFAIFIHEVIRVINSILKYAFLHKAQIKNKILEN